MVILSFLSEKVYAKTGLQERNLEYAGHLKSMTKERKINGEKNYQTASKAEA